MKAWTTEGPGGLGDQIAPEARAWLSVFTDVSHWLIVPHMKPDADTLGSSLGMARLLRALGREVAIVCADPVLTRFGFLPGAESVSAEIPDGWPADSGVVTLDAAEIGRLGGIASLVAGFRPFVNLDHHISNQLFGSHNWIDLASAATGELVVLLYDHFGVSLDAEAAAPLYAALVTDTGFFRYPSTTPRTLEIAARLLRTGVDFAGVIEAIYERQQAATIRLMGRALADVRIEAAGRVAWTAVSREMLEATGASEDDAEGIVEKLREIAGVEVLYILKEASDGIRVSLRAKGDRDVNALARHFGGGGHLKAAGCVIHASLDQASEQLREVVLAHLGAPVT